LAVLGDLVDRPVDLFSLPSPRQLGLPDSGAFSLLLTSSPRQLGLELVYESNPMEVFLALGGVKTAFIGGLVAGMAAPMIADYRTRMEMQQAVAVILQHQARLAVFHAERGRFPASAETDSFMEPVGGPSDLELRLEADTGRLSVLFRSESFQGEPQLILTPEVSEGGILWHCQGAPEVEHLSTALCTP
jgi:hypothetical protein